jgi:hypothetical protein
MIQLQCVRGSPDFMTAMAATTMSIDRSVESRIRAGLRLALQVARELVSRRSSSR